MKKAVISTGSKQYIVQEGDTLDVELVNGDAKTVDFMPLMVIDGDQINLGTPELTAKVTAQVVEGEVKADKVTSIRYKSKKRVRKVHGHRQHLTRLKITKIA